MPATRYDPMSTFLPDRRIGQYLVRGNHDRAEVCRLSFLLGIPTIVHPCIVRLEDNRDGPPEGRPASAFERAYEWASKQEGVPCS